MTIEPDDIHPERARLETLIAIKTKQVARAAEKKRAAERELDEMLDGLTDAQAEHDAWVKANPDQQRSIFEVLAA
jgi:hypothetical protein